MAREPELFTTSKGNPVDGFLKLRAENKNIPRSWIDRTKGSRKKIEEELTQLLQDSDLSVYPLLNDWLEIFKKEMFYYGIRVLFELERNGDTDL